MAEKKKNIGGAVPEKKETAYATVEQFSRLEESMAAIADALVELKNKPVPVAAPETKEEKEIRAAGPDRVDTNPIWDEHAREILGDTLDHTEVSHTKDGGVLFTVVIKTEKSNASKEYLASVKSDRRTKEVSTEGSSGVDEWCKQIAANLKRTAKVGK